MKRTGAEQTARTVPITFQNAPAETVEGDSVAAAGRWRGGVVASPDNGTISLPVPSGSNARRTVVRREQSRDVELIHPRRTARHRSTDECLDNTLVLTALIWTEWIPWTRWR